MSQVSARDSWKKHRSGAYGLLAPTFRTCRTQTGNDDIVMIYWSIFLFYLDFTIIVPGVHHEVLRRPLHGLRLRPLPRRGDPHGQAL